MPILLSIYYIVKGRRERGEHDQVAAQCLNGRQGACPKCRVLHSNLAAACTLTIRELPVEMRICVALCLNTELAAPGKYTLLLLYFRSKKQAKFMRLVLP